MQESQEDKIISAFLNSIGGWKEHIVIGGGFALFIYKLYLADQKLQNPPVGTRDIDTLIPRRVPETVEKDIAKHLQEAGFSHVFKDLDNPATEAYTKEIDGMEVEIEFLTDSSTRTDKNKNVVVAGVVAQPLSYLTLSLQRKVVFHTYSNEVGQVVSPEAWIFHKGLTFPKRYSPLKKLKDLYGIWYVSTQLGDLSDQAITEFHHLSRQHPKWYDTWRKNIGDWIDQSSPADWSQLEKQDPSGRLRKLNFERAIKKLHQE